MIEDNSPSESVMHMNILEGWMNTLSVLGNKVSYYSHYQHNQITELALAE
jgi:hypothetical protein